MQYASIIISYVILCCFLALIGNIFIFKTIAQEGDQAAQDWLNFTGLITDVAAFVVIGFIGYMATKVNGWIKNNKEWKASIETKFDKTEKKIVTIENETRNNTQKLDTAIELLISDLKEYKKIHDRETNEMSKDYDMMNTVVTENKIEIKRAKEDIREIERDLKKK